MNNHSLLFKTLQETSRFHGETNDCTVKALAIAGDVTYGVAHTMMAKQGRKKGHGAPALYILNSLRKLGKKVDEVTILSAFQGIKTIKSLQTLGLKGCYLVRVSGHVLTMKDGIVHDWTNGRQHRIVNIYRIQ